MDSSPARTFPSRGLGESFRAGKLVELLRVDEEHERRAWEIIVTFDDKDFSYTDATSFAVAESLGIDDAFSLDRHFREFGRLRVLPPLTERRA